ncbi:MAG: 50S ribosomal protein L23 [bacterium]|nr:50S ribosomal protein L23 [bacterium]
MALFNKKTEDKKKSETAEKPEAKSMKDLYSGAGESVKGKAAAVVKKAAYGNAYKILAKPLVTEKVSNLGVLNKYVFAVSAYANKIEVAKAVKEVYGVKPVSVNIIKMQGKIARYGRISGRRKDWKKAIVTLPKGETIKVYEGV